MFKKTLVAAALAGALVGSAFAANVSLYGKVDMGLQYVHDSKTDYAGLKTTSNNFTLDSGIDSASRFGLKGSEELGNGYTVSFKLENGFSADDGQLNQGTRLFGREASLTLAGAFGQLSVGRMGGLGSSAGTYDLVYAIGDAFDGGGSLVGPYIASDRYDNVVTYQTPKFAGVQATAQYSFKNDNKKDAETYVEGKATADRYAAFALTGEFGNFQAVAAYERQMFSSVDLPTQDDQNTFYLGGNYDFGVAKVFLLGQYFDGAREVGSSGYDSLDTKSFLHSTFNGSNALDTTDGLKGYGLHLGTVVPVAGGDLTVGFYYGHAKADNMGLASVTSGSTTTAADSVDVKTNFYNAEIRYEYPLSKRTTLYTGAAYGYEKVKAEAGRKNLTGDNGTAAAYTDGKQTTAGAYVGLIHNF